MSKLLGLPANLVAGGRAPSAQVRRPGRVPGPSASHVLEPPAAMPVPTGVEDRNRTAPFPFCGNRFEFRAVGSAQNVSLVNTVLNTITANAFKEVADRIEGGETAQAVAADLINTHVPKVVFNGDNYDEANQEMLTKRGVWRIDSGVEATTRLTADKNVALFSTHGIFRQEELEAREEVLLDHYAGHVEMEALCMVDMINQHVIPACEGGRHTGRKSSAEFPLGLTLGTPDSAEKWVVLAPDGAVAAKLNLKKGKDRRWRRHLRA